MYKKNIFCYILCGILKPSNFEISVDIFHFGRLILSIGFQKTDFKDIFIYIPSYVFHTFCLIYPALSDEKFRSIGFHKTCHILGFQGIANNSSYVFHTFCLLDIPSSVRQKISKYWFQHDLSFFQISRNCKYFKLCFPHFLLDIPSSVRQKFSKYWFPHDLSSCFQHFLFDISSSVRQKLFKYWFPHGLSFFQI